MRTAERTLSLTRPSAVIVVDNGSTDGTASALASRFPQVETISLPANLGAAGRNAGVRQAQTPYVALCDDDTWWAPGALARAADCFDAHRRLGILTGRILVGEDGREDPTCARMADSPLPRVAGLPGVPVLGFMAGACMVRRSAFLAAGGFEPRFFLGGEERLLATDLYVAGWDLIYANDVIIHHFPSPRRDAPARRRLLWRNALWFSWLRRPAASVLRGSLRALWQGAIDATLRPGFLDAVAGLPWALRHRRTVSPPVERLLRLLAAAESAQTPVSPSPSMPPHLPP
jgi:GT2 family glycosyltransferase